MRGDGWEDYLEGRERMDFIKTARPQWKNLKVSNTGRLNEFFDQKRSLCEVHNEPGSHLLLSANGDHNFHHPTLEIIYGLGLVQGKVNNQETQNELKQKRQGPWKFHKSLIPKIPT